MGQRQPLKLVSLAEMGQPPWSEQRPLTFEDIPNATRILSNQPRADLGVAAWQETPAGARIDRSSE